MSKRNTGCASVSRRETSVFSRAETREPCHHAVSRLLDAFVAGTVVVGAKHLERLQNQMRHTHKQPLEQRQR